VTRVPTIGLRDGAARDTDQADDEDRHQSGGDRDDAGSPVAESKHVIIYDAGQSMSIPP
jgi:hypothetical protein